MSRAPPTKQARKTRLQSADVRPSVNQKMVVFGRCILRRIPNCQLGGDGGRGIYPGNPSPTSIRNHTRFSEKNQVKLRRCLKYQTNQFECMVYLNTHWQPRLGSAAVGETWTSRPTTHKWILRMPKYSIAKIKIKYYIFLFQPNFCLNPVAIQQILWDSEYFPGIYRALVR